MLSLNWGSNNRQCCHDNNTDPRIIVHFIVVYSYLLKKSVRRTDTLQMAETGARDSRHDFEDVVQIERTPIPDTNDWQHPDVTTSNLLLNLLLI